MNQEPVIVLATDTKIMGYGESDSSGCWVKLQLLPEHMDAIRGRRGDVVDIVIAEQSEPQCEPITAKPKAKAKGEHGKAWAQLYRNNWWLCPEVWPLLGTDAEYQAWCRTKPCVMHAISGCSGDIVTAHVRRIALGAGTGIKPEYATIPLCHAHHETQHQYGEHVAGGKEAFDKWLEQHRTEWLKQVIREWFGVESCSQIEPVKLGRWIKSLTDGLAYASLPKEFKA